MVTRRTTLKALGVGAGGLAGGLSMPWRLAHGDSLQQLRIPALMAGEARADGRHFTLNAQRGETEFFPGRMTPTLGINGSYLGPTLRFGRGDDIRVHVNNSLGEATTIHWHGLHVPQAADGGPHSTIADGESWDASFDIRQQAGTYWYHSHMMHRTGEQVYRGLAGMIIVDDEISRGLPLPSDYGVDDIPVIIQDRRFDREGGFHYMNTYQDMMMGMFGDTILVNGTVSPQFGATTGKLRLRILNGCNARMLTLAFSDARKFHFLAGDGGFVEQPVRMEQIVLTPGERAEILVDVSDGKPVKLINLPNPHHFPEFPGAMSQMMRQMNSEAFEVLNIRPEDSRAASADVPDKLTTVPRISEGLAVKTRRFRLNMGNGPRSGGSRGPGTGHRNGYGGGHGGGHFSINGRTMSMGYINERVSLGDTEIWEIFNDSPMMHPFHIHGGLFQILDRSNAAPPAHERGYKDTVRVDAHETVRVIMAFTDFADEHIPYMYHCHTLEHEDRGMMGQFLVVQQKS